MPRKKPNKRAAEVRRLGERIRIANRDGGYPALGEFAEIACKVWGGVDKLVEDIKLVADNAEDGSVAKHRALNSVVELVKAAAKQQQDRRVDDEMLSDEDLRAEFYELTGIEKPEKQSDIKHEEATQDHISEAHDSGCRADGADGKGEAKAG